MNEGFEEFLATIIEQCLVEHDMQPPLVVATMGDNGSVLVAGFNEGAELVALTQHCENDTFTLPIKVTIVSQNNRTARLVIELRARIFPVLQEFCGDLRRLFQPFCTSL